MPASIGVNLRVTGHCRQGGRKYMEDFFSVAYQQTEDEKDLEYAFFGIYDGHGGAEAAAYAKEHLLELIVRQKNFWSDNDEDVLRAIKEGYISTHYAMWREQAKWPKTPSGLPSTAGTTASIAFLRRGKIYIGHVGDSGIVLGYQDPNSDKWIARPLTKDHKPESACEIQRIEQCGGKVIAKSGVPRVVWNRPRLGHQGPIRRSTPIDEIPFLAVSRSLGDLWSYNSQLDEFVVSPDPDCLVVPIDANSFRCLVFGTDGLYNMLSPQMVVSIVQKAEKHNEDSVLSDDTNKIWINPSKCLVEKALERWSTTKMRADNTSVITLFLDPPGPPKAQVLQDRKRKAYPDSGLEIVTRFGDEEKNTPKRLCMNDSETNSIDENTKVDSSDKDSQSNLSASNMLRQISAEHSAKNVETVQQDELLDSPTCNDSFDKSVCEIGTNTEDVDKDFVIKTRESTSYDVRELNDENVQINEVSSSLVEAEEDQSSSEPSLVKEKTKCDSPSEENENRPVLRGRNSKGVTKVREKKEEVKKGQENTINTRQYRLRGSVNSDPKTKKPNPSEQTPSSSGTRNKRDWNKSRVLQKLNNDTSVSPPSSAEEKKEAPPLRRSLRSHDANVSAKRIKTEEEVNTTPKQTVIKSQRFTRSLQRELRR